MGRRKGKRAWRRWCWTMAALGGLAGAGCEKTDPSTPDRSETALNTPREDVETPNARPEAETMKTSETSPEGKAMKRNEGTGIVSDVAAFEGCSIRYLVAGPEGGQPVLFLHGASFQAATWRDNGILERVAKTGRRAWAVDLPGHGESSSCGLATNAFLEKLIDVLKMGRPVVISPSMSGRYSLPLVTGKPEAVAGYVAVAPVALREYQDALERITVPVLAIWGENDRVVPLEQGELLAKSVANGRWVVLKDAGHACYMNQPAAFTDHLLAFLDEVAGQGQEGT